MGQGRSFGSEAHGQDTTPVMGDNYGSLFVAFIARVHTILGPQGDDQLGQFLQDVCCSIFFQALCSSISRKVNRNKRNGLLQSGVSDNVSPDRPAIWESVDEDDQWFIGVDCFRCVRDIVTDKVKLESALQS